MTFVTGSISHGQGHATIQTQMLVDRLGVDPERIKFVAGDTDAVAFGMGTGGSRSTTMSGGAIVAVSDKIIAKGKKPTGGRLLGGGRCRHRDQPNAGQGGQVLTGSFMDYAMPRADNFCAVAIEDNPVPTPTNPLGVKGAGEAGTVGSLSAGANAIVDALSVLGVRHIDTPCTPYRVWQAIQDARARDVKSNSPKS